MIRTIGLKLAHLVPVMFLVSLATFFMLELVPGDAAATVAGPNATLPQDGYNHIRVAPDGSFLIVFQNLGNMSGAALQVAADSLTTIRTTVTEGVNNHIREIIISEDSREVVFLWGNWNYTNGHIIEARDATTGALLRVGFARPSQDFDYLNGFVPLPDNRIALLFLSVAVLVMLGLTLPAPLATLLNQSVKIITH